MVAVILVFAFPAVLLALFYQRSLAAELKDSRSPTVISLLFTPSVSFWDVVPSNTLSRGLLCFAATLVVLFVLETLIFYSTYDLRGPLAPRASSGMPRVVLQYILTFLVLCSVSLVLGTLAQALLWWLLAVALSPSEYMPLAAAAAALGSHIYGAIMKGRTIHLQLQKGIKKAILDALAKRCEEPLAKLLAELGLDVADTQGASTASCTGA